MPQRRRRLCAASLSAALQPAGGPLRLQLPCFAPIGACPARIVPICSADTCCLKWRAASAAAGAAPPAASSTLRGRLEALLFNHKGVGNTDYNYRERFANVATSVPLAWLGLRLLLRSPAAPPPARRYGAALLGVSAAAVGYHTSAGDVRPHARQVDYLSIGLASWVRLLLNAHPGLPSRR